MNKDTQKVLRLAKKRGWRVEQSKSHFRLTWKNGTAVSTAITPSCPHSYKHILRDMDKVEKGIW